MAIGVAGSVNPISYQAPQAMRQAAFRGTETTQPKSNSTQQPDTGLIIIGTGLALAGILFGLSRLGSLKYITKRFLKGTEKRASFGWNEALAHMKETHPKAKNFEKSFIMRYPEADRKNCDTAAKEIIALGYYRKGNNNPIFTKVIACDKLENDLLQKFGSENVIICV